MKKHGGINEATLTTESIDQKQFNDGSVTIQNIKAKLAEKHGVEKVENGMVAIKKEREILKILTLRRKALNMGQQILAESVKTTRQQIIRYENNQQEPSLSKLINICEQLGVEITLKEKDSRELLYHT